MTLLIVGPTEIEQDILAVGALPQVYMRTPEFSSKLEEIYDNLQYIFQTRNPCLLFASSGTGALNAAVDNFVAKGDEVVVINGGSFGKRWVELNQRVGANIIEATVDFGKSIVPSQIRQLLTGNPKVTALFATLNETSSGALTDVKALGEMLKEFPEILFIVDCVSALVVEPFKMDEWGIDVAVTASQKALALPPGLAFMALSSKAIKKAEAVGTRPFYFDVLEYLKNWLRNQTPFTPAVGLVLQLEQRLKKIRAEGLSNLQARYFKLTEYLRGKMAELGFIMIPEHPANCVSAYWSAPYNASEIIEILRTEYNLEIAPSGGELKNKMFRIGNFGNITYEDIDNLIEKLKITLAKLQVKNKNDRQ